MSDIFITVRNQNENAMTSVDGVAFVAILGKDGLIIEEKPVNLRYADAQFANLTSGDYTVIVFHQSVNPPEARQDVTLSEDELLEVRFIYSEPERQLLRIRIQRFPFDFNSY
jgi:hypothetical protein